MDIKKEYERWLAKATADADVAAELKTLDDAKIEDAFYRDLAFGTGGLRGVIGAGSNRMNIYTIRRATQGLADYINAAGLPKKVAIGHDSRHKGELFSREAARAKGQVAVKAVIDGIGITPDAVQFGEQVRILHCAGAPEVKQFCIGHGRMSFPGPAPQSCSAGRCDSKSA